MTQANYPSAIAQPAAAAQAQPAPMPDVGEILRRLDASRVLTGVELEQHIADCCALWQSAYARFQEHNNPADREEALLWLHHQNAAILMRPGMEVFLPSAARRIRDGC